MTRWYAIGDPQTTFEKFLEVLRGNHLLEGDRLRDDVGLISMGDHFDFHSDRPRDEVARAGTTILRWLSSQSQVEILLGNHDAARVMELAFETDASFAAAQEMAKTKTDAEFAAAFPRIPARGIATRDYSSFAVHQREIVQELLLAGRFRLGLAARRGDHELLLTHAGVTNREVDLLGVAASPSSIASALNARLRDAVERVRAAWERGEPAALDLAPLHAPGAAGEEGGGLLYHRPSTKPRDAWSSSGVAPRRFDPAILPRDLVQACGHTGHHKCKGELGSIMTPAARARAHGGLRTLRHDRYDLGLHPPEPGIATMYLIDTEMNRDLAEDGSQALLGLTDVARAEDRDVHQ